jgi:hypothetical protein
MSTFYLLPPRSFLGECLTASLRPLFPAICWTGTVGTELAEALAAALVRHPDVYVVFREELPEGETPSRALADGFGAEPNDEVVEIYPGKRSGELTSRSWRLETDRKRGQDL